MRFRSRARLAACAAALAASGGCMVVGRRVALTYEPSKDVVRGEHKTAIQVVAFTNKSDRPRSIGQAPTLIPGVQEPLRAGGDVAAWVTKSVAVELSAMGYKVVPESEWKVGGSVQDVSCSGGKVIACSMTVEIGVRSKGNWQVLKRGYKGDGSMPPLFQNADLYELSLEEALRDVLDGFKRDFELTVP